MRHQDWFDDLPVLGKLPPGLAAVKLREIGDDHTAAALERSAAEQDTELVSFGVDERGRTWPLRCPRFNTSPGTGTTGPTTRPAARSSAEPMPGA